MLKEVFGRWEEALAAMSEPQIAAPQLVANWSVKDVIAHLWAWQRLSIARLEAALLDREPEFSEWPSELDPDSEDDVDQINALIYQTYLSWPKMFIRARSLSNRLVLCYNHGLRTVTGKAGYELILSL